MERTSPDASAAPNVTAVPDASTGSGHAAGGAAAALSREAAWPALPLAGWRETYETLHLWAQVVGKIALGYGPRLNHSWGAALHPTPRGLSTLLLHHGGRAWTLELDLLEHRLVVRGSSGEVGALELVPRTVAAFYRETVALLERLGLPVCIWPVAVELERPIRLDADTAHARYEREPVERLHRILLSATRVLSDARAAFVGKASPVHFFWGSFDLAMSRFSGRRAPPIEGPAFMREAYSHEVISHGFWPGGWAPAATVDEPVFYGYAAPVPEGLADEPVEPEAAYWHPQLGEFVLPYEAVRRAPSPEAALRAFLDSSYAAAAKRARWDRAALDRPVPV